MYIYKYLTAPIFYSLSRHYLRDRSNSDTGVFGYIFVI